MTSELEEAMNEFPQTYNPLNELNERQFDRQRAFGLLFLNVSRNELTSEKVSNEKCKCVRIVIIIT